MEQYDHKKIEKKWQAIWEEKGLYKAPQTVERSKKKYILPQLPYPSGSGLHVGHAEVYTACDIYSRYCRMKGYTVLQAIGWDAFGLPAENYAIKTNVHPRLSTDTAIENYRRQIRSLGISMDWEREVGSHNPDYYKWTQWFFLLLYEQGLAYRKKQAVNWCESCKTVLANEQVVAGSCERCGTTIIQREMEQWFLNITKYADRLYDDLDKVDWPQETIKRQRDWIGRSEGALIKFSIANFIPQEQKNIEVFTTRPDTLFGATYIVLAPEHALIPELQDQISNWEEVQEYIHHARHKTDLDRQIQKEKTGVRLEGIMAINPGSGEEIPVWIADYVLAHYGTGAIMAVPAHDERDWEFAQTYSLPIRQVIAPHYIDQGNPPRTDKPTVPRVVVQGVVRNLSDNTVLQIVWKKQPWKTFVIGGVEEGEDLIEAVKREVYEETGYKNFRSIRKIGWEMRTQWYAAHKNENRFAHMHVFELILENEARDDIAPEEQEKHDITWVPFNSIPTSFSPIAEMHGIWPPLNSQENSPYEGEGLLINSGEFDGITGNEAKEAIIRAVGAQKKTTYKLRDWLVSRQRFWGAPIPVVYDPEGTPHPLTLDDLPVLLPDDVDFKPTGQSPLTYSSDFQKGVEKKYGKGWKREVDTLDTFVCSSWYYFRYLDPKNDKEFASKEALASWMPIDFYLGGAEHVTGHLLYSRFFTKVLYDAGYIAFDEPFQKTLHQGLILGEDHRKMSKRWGNVINPTDMVERFGADTMRIYEMFMGPLEATKPWDMNGMVGVRRFLERVWRMQEKVIDTQAVSDITVERLLHKTIKQVTQDLESFKFNTAISSLMILSNKFDTLASIPKLWYNTLLVILGPFSPHISEELWHNMSNAGLVHEQSWPEYNSDLLVDEEITIPVQINGKVRATVQCSPDISSEEIQALALAESNVIKWLDNKEIKKILYIPQKVVTIVI